MARRASALSRISEIPSSPRTKRLVLDDGPPSGFVNTTHLQSSLRPLEPPLARPMDYPGTLYLKLQPRVARIIRALLGETPSFDLVHDVCVDAALSADTFRGESAFSSWLYSVVARHVHKWIRTERRRRSLLREVGRHAVGIDFLQPDELVNGNRLASKVLDAMNTLSARQRTCVIEVQFEGQTVQSVADRLGISPDAVRMNVHRARTHLRTLLE